MIDYERLKAREFPAVEQAVTSKDAILYALGLGVGTDPLDEAQLRFVFEEADGFAALPFMAVVLAGPGFWVRQPDSGVTWQKVLHGEQGLEMHGPLPAEGVLVGQTRIEEIIDNGEGKGALIYLAKELTEKKTGRRVATSYSTTFARADGGFGGPSGPKKPVHRLPEREPDLVEDMATLPQAALIYRLSGDPNPLHASPEGGGGGGVQGADPARALLLRRGGAGGA